MKKRTNQTTIFMRALTLLLALLMVVSLAACGDANNSANEGAGASNQGAASDNKTPGENADPQEITMQLVTWNAEVPEKNCPLYEEIEKELNIKLNINYVLAANAFDKINTTLAGGDLPDVLMLLNDTARNDLIQQAGEAGMFWDLTDYLDDYPLLKENTEPYLKSMTYDGQIIAIPRRTMDRTGGMILREDWLENLGLEVPRTLDDLYNVFKAFTYDDPDGNGVDDTVGFAMAGIAVRPVQAAAGITAWDYFVDEETQEVKHFCTEPGYKVYLDFLKKCYDEGIITRDFASINGSQGREMFNQQKAGAFTANFANVGVGTAYNALFATNPDAKIICMSEIEAPDGTLCCVGSEGYYGMYAFPKSAVETEEELRGILSFFEYTCQPDMVEKYAFGVEGVHYEFDADGKFQWLDKNDKEMNYAFAVDSTGVASNSVLMLEHDLFPHAREYYDFQYQEGVKNWFSVKTWFAANSDDAAVSDVVNEAATKYVMGEATYDAVEAAIQEWLNGGGQSKLDDWTAQYRAMVG